MYQGGGRQARECRVAAGGYAAGFCEEAAQGVAGGITIPGVSRLKVRVSAAPLNLYIKSSNFISCKLIQDE